MVEGCGGGGGGGSGGYLECVSVGQITATSAKWIEYCLSKLECFHGSWSE